MASSPYFALAVLFVAALCLGLAPLALARLWAKIFSPGAPSFPRLLRKGRQTLNLFIWMAANLAGEDYWPARIPS
jgi:hypothetical protein